MTDLAGPPGLSVHCNVPIPNDAGFAEVTISIPDLSKMTDRHRAFVLAVLETLTAWTGDLKEAAADGG